MKLLRKILFPFSVLYGLIVFVRNKMFDKNILSSKSYPFPVICIGNLSVGGTGKSPMVEYLINLLKSEHKIATLSRGYKRTTKGFRLLSGNETTSEVGDEPLQFKTKFPEIMVSVDEDRQDGIAKLRDLKTPPEIILLDDAFQHRKVTAGLNILLSSYGDLYIDDFILPTGNLREPRSGAKRSDIIVVTKCPPTISLEEQEEIRGKLKLDKNQSLYFSTIMYNEKVLNAFSSKELINLGSFTLVTGIANPRPLVEFLKKLKLNFKHLAFPDHHHFTNSELDVLQQHKTIVTTEKDYMRLKNELPVDQLFYLSIGTEIIGGSKAFDREIINFVNV